MDDRTWSFTRFPNHHFSSLICAAGIGRTFWHRKVIPAQTACRETYGLLLYAGVAQSVEHRTRRYAQVQVLPPAQEAG